MTLTYFFIWYKLTLDQSISNIATLPAEMFGGSDFWLETRVIIKILKKMIPHMKPKVFFIRKKQNKKIFFEKKNPKWPTQKKVIFQNRQFSIFFSENFMDWSLG